MLNKFVWQNYLESERGQLAISTFEAFLSSGNISDQYIDFIFSLQSSWCPSSFVLNYTKQQLLDLQVDLAEGYGALDEGEYTIATAIDALYNGLSNNGEVIAKDVFNNFSDSVAYYTTLLATEIPDLLVPYYFTWNFNVFEKIAQEFDIELLPIPAKRDYEDRLYYYGAICIALYEFREKHNMSPYELCAFLYDFAPKYIGGIDSYIVKELPPPRSAYFIGGSKNDIFLANEANTITSWQCSPDTQVGDMIVMYLRSPISAVDSIWRSVSIGFNDPFFYYYRCTYIANPVGINRITQKQLEQDEFFKNLPIIRKNMQGINGVELKPTEYNHLVDISKADVPRLQFDVIDNDYNFVNEKDVERKLIVPLIEKLGYSSSEYKDKLQIMVGNHNFKLIPDYTILPKVTTGHHSAFAIIEAKHHIPNKKALDEACSQARSYAVQLKAKYSVIASKDKIWIYKPDDDYTSAAFSATWSELNNPDTFSALFKMIGKKAK